MAWIEEHKKTGHPPGGSMSERGPAFLCTQQSDRAPHHIALSILRDLTAHRGSRVPGKSIESQSLPVAVPQVSRLRGVGRLTSRGNLRSSRAD